MTNTAAQNLSDELGCEVTINAFDEDGELINSETYTPQYPYDETDLVTIVAPRQMWAGLVEWITDAANEDDDRDAVANDARVIISTALIDECCQYYPLE